MEKKTHLLWINSLIGSSGLIIVPNPVTKERKFQVNESGTLSIYSLQGALIMEQMVNKEEKIAVNNLLSGTYFLQLKNKSGSVKSAKIIVK